MLDRASTFAHPEIISLLQADFVPVAIDQWYTRRQKDNLGEFWRKVAGQGPRSDFNRTTQGFYLIDPAGRLIAYNNNRGPERLLELLQRTREDYRHPDDAEPLEAGTRDARFDPRLPDGAIVVRVGARIPSGYEETDDQWRKIFQQAVSRDNLWITAGEQAELLADRMPLSLARRIARFHLVDNTRGEPPTWRLDEIRRLEFSVRDGVLSGEADLRTKQGDRSFVAKLQGRVAGDRQTGRVESLEWMVEGTFEGTGPNTMQPPPGPFPLQIGFSLADGKDLSDSIAPHASRGWLDGYLDPER